MREATYDGVVCGVRRNKRDDVMSDTTALYAALDALTRPTSRPIDRAPLEWLGDGRGTFCRVTDYRASILATGRIPSLWQQAEWALTGAEAGDGSGGKTPSRERTPADLDLMETMLTIRESMAWQLKGRRINPKPTMPEQMRQLATFIAGHEPQHVDWWTYRLTAWARMLTAHLNAIDAAPKPVYLRGAACPLCRCRTVTVERDDQRIVVPALKVEFAQSLIHYTNCGACGSTWFRGEQMNRLADKLSDADGTMTA